MRSFKNYLIVLLALSTLTAGYMAWKKAREIVALKDALAASKPEVVARKRAWSQQRLVGTDAGPGLHPGPEANQEAGAPPDQEMPQRRGESAFRAMMENPEYQKLMAITQKGMLDRRFAALFKQLGLSPEVLDKFKNLLLEKQNAVIDVAMAARDQGLNPRTDPEGFRALLANAQGEIDASIRSAIGDEAFATYQTYEQTMPYRNVVEQLASRLSYSVSPLTNAQTEQMVSILAATNLAPNLPAGSLRAVTLPFGGLAGSGTALNNEAMNRAQGILTPDQYSALQQLQQEQQAQAQMRSLIRQQLRQPATPSGSTSKPSG